MDSADYKDTVVQTGSFGLSDYFYFVRNFYFGSQFCMYHELKRAIYIAELKLQ